MAAAALSVPGATDLGLGSTLGQQVADETDEERKKRLLSQTQQRILPGTSGASSLMSGYGAAVPFP